MEYLKRPKNRAPQMRVKGVFGWMENSRNRELKNMNEFVRMRRKKKKGGAI